MYKLSAFEPTFRIPGPLRRRGASARHVEAPVANYPMLRASVRRRHLKAAVVNRGSRNVPVPARAWKTPPRPLSSELSLPDRECLISDTHNRLSDFENPTELAPLGLCKSYVRRRNVKEPNGKEVALETFLLFSTLVLSRLLNINLI